MEKGVTLLELVVVMVILSIIASASFATFSTGNQIIYERVFYYQLESSYQKASGDATSIGEESILIFNEDSYGYSSEKFPQPLDYFNYKKIPEEDVGKEVLFNRFGAVEAEETVTFILRNDNEYVVVYGEGYRNITINEEPIEIFEKRWFEE